MSRRDRKRCRDCDARLLWARTWPARKSVALDAVAASDGYVRLIGLDDADEISDALGLPRHMVTINDAPLGVAVVITDDELTAARGLEYTLHTIHRSTCPNPKTSNRSEKTG